MADKPLDTGDNGFPIDGVKQTFDVGVPDTQAITNGQPGYGAFKPGVNVSDGFNNADGTPKDLSKPTKTTLAQYLSRVTMAKEGSSRLPNKYPVDGDSTTTTSTTDPNTGYPSGLETPPANSNTFAGGAQATFDYPTQQYPAIQGLIKKGKANNSNVDGNDLLPGVSGGQTYTANPDTLSGDSGTAPGPLPGHADTSAKIINPYTSAVLASNRFTSAAAAYTTVKIDDPDPNYDPTFPQQGKLGYHDPKAPTLSAGRLATIGPLLGLRATTTVGSSAGGADPNGAGLQASALLPAPAQLGVATIDQHMMLASDILGQLTNNEVPSSDVISPGSQSWGQLNDVNDPYSGTDALGMLTLSIALTVGLTLVIDLLSLILGAITPQVKQPTHDKNGRYILGQYYANEKTGAQGKGGGGALGAISALASLNFGALLGLNPTNYPFQQAMQSGFNAFFGLPQGGGGFGNIGGQLLGSLTSSTDSPQFNIIVARAIIRSSITIVDSIKKIGGNPMNVINAILSLIDTIRSSKIIAAMNVWATLGDAILSTPDTFSDQASGDGNKVSEMDTVDDATTNAIGKNRLQGTLKLAWASNRAPANLLLPSSIFAVSLAATGLGQPNLVLGANEDPYSKVQSTVTHAADNGRLDSTSAAAFEQLLEAEYVPFYFHDVRTNEMVAFHAFLASLGDSFAAQYEKTDAFGRVEPVRIYKSTERKIDMSFYIAATSPQDFEEMWVKINKLVTLLYPQYTQGQTLTDATGNQFIFTQPFSQLAGSSPLVRLRLGNLLHTNYSRFHLARLFGMGNNSKDAPFTLGGQTLTGDDAIDAGVLQKFGAALAQAQSNPNGETYFISHGVFPFFDTNGSGGGGLSLPAPSVPGLSSGPQGPKNAPQLNTGKIWNNFYIAKAKQVNPNNPLELVCEIMANDDTTFQTNFASYIPKFDARYNNDSYPTQKIVGGTYSIPVNALKATPKTYKQLTGNISQLANIASSNSAFFQSLTDFLDPTKNAIVKSFEDVGGNGLAGFIETMAFDWYDKVTWETTMGNVAPKLCKVTISFAPIHDISPGIDHLGFNRAPIYPVGTFAQSAK